jgi:glycosyltransferase involved in cell wall biosynthesis
MTVSVIVPNYNHARYLKQRIDSILNQTYRDFEIIILDDCSTDGSREIIDNYTSHFSFIRSFYNSENSGSPFIQWDSGVSRAKGDFIWIAESDDFAEPEFLEKAVAAMNGDKSPGLVYCDSKVTDERNKTEYLVSERKTFFSKSKWHHNYTSPGRKEIEDQLYLANTINNASSVLFRKSKYIEAGFAGKSMTFCGDWFIYIRILLISDIAYIAEPLNNFRLHQKSTFNSYYSSNTYFKEVLFVYSFVMRNVRLTLKKKILIALNIARIAVRRMLSILKIRKMFRIG